VQGWFGGEGILGGVAGELVKHIDDVKQEESRGGGFASLGGFGDKVIKLGSSQVGHEINAATDGNTKLAEGEEEGCKVVGEDGSNEGANDAAPGGSYTDGAKFK
jgi:hypothetical protein